MTRAGPTGRAPSPPQRSDLDASVLRTRRVGQTDRRRGDHVHVGHDRLSERGDARPRADRAGLQPVGRKTCDGDRDRQIPHHRADVSFVRLQGRRDRERRRRCGHVSAGQPSMPQKCFRSSRPRALLCTGGPPTIFIALLDENRKRSATFAACAPSAPGGNIVPSGDDPRAASATRASAPILNAYGLTKRPRSSHVTDPNDDPERIANTAGYRDRRRRSPMRGPRRSAGPRGAPGEIHVKGYNVMAGYFEDDAATRKAMTVGRLAEDRRRRRAR